MSITKLYIFNKNTDAHASIRGIEYQLLHTLRDWVIEYLENKGVDIYCEYGDDIVLLNSAAASVKFKQVKCYSEDFSVNSKEVKKTLLNFFMLFASPEYLLTDISFVFETNAGVIKKDSKETSLLSKWRSVNGSGVDAAVVKEIALELKNIITEQLVEQAGQKIKSIHEQIAKIESEKSPEKNKLEVLKDKKRKIEEGLNYVKGLNEDAFSNFAKKVSFTFHHKAPEKAIIDLTTEIEGLILKLPFEIDKDDAQGAFAALRWAVSQTAIKTEPENRKLAREALRDCVLSAENHKWYVDLKQKFETLDFSVFSFGDYLDLRSAVRHARQNNYLDEDRPFWRTQLEKFIELPQFNNTEFRRVGIYELIFISIFSNALGDYKELITEYFDSFEAFAEPDDLENAIISLSLITAAAEKGRLDIDESLIDKWSKKLISWIDHELTKDHTVNRKALLLDLRAESAFQIESHYDRKKAFNDGLNYLKLLIPLIKEASLYPIFKLSDRITNYLHLLSNSDEIDLTSLEELSLQVNELHAEKEGKFSLAKIYKERGVNFYKDRKLLKSIEYFHKAKLLYFSDEGLVGTILGTLLISGSFINLQMLYAAKYYGYCAAFLSSTAPQLKNAEKFFPSSLAKVVIADYKAGNWIGFFDSADGYLGVHFQLESDDPLNPKRKEDFEHVLFSALILEYVTERLYPDFSVFVKFRIACWNSIPSNLLSALRITVKDLLSAKTNSELTEWVELGFSQTPFSDVGEFRTITWKCMGIEWNLKFKNDYLTTSLAEEFCAMFQIFQVDLSNEDYITFKNRVDLEIEITTGKFEFKHFLDIGEHKWQIKIPEFKGSKTHEVNVHYFDFIRLMNTIISTVGLLTPAKCYEIFERHVKDELGSKTTPVKPYEILYRELVHSESFELSQRSKFLKVTSNQINPSESDELKWKGDPTLNNEGFKAYIKNIYSICPIGLSVSLEEILADDVVQVVIAELRKKGWKDWHILLSIYELSLNFKCSTMLGDTASIQEFQKKRSQLWGKDEKDSFIPLPISMFTIENLKVSLLETMPQTMDAIGLYHTSPVVNLLSIQELLDKRYLFWQQDLDHDIIF